MIKSNFIQEIREFQWLYVKTCAVCGHVDSIVISAQLTKQVIPELATKVCALMLRHCLLVKPQYIDTKVLKIREAFFICATVSR